jgi:hypothetical protein
MPTESSYPAVDIPNVDLWGLVFEQKRKEAFPDDQGIQPPPLLRWTLRSFSISKSPFVPAYSKRRKKSAILTSSSLPQ